MAERLFWFFAGTAIAGALLVVTLRNPIASAFCLIVTMLSLASIFFMLQAHFIGAVQILVYAGAVMVLFLFVIMLLNLGHGGSDMKGAPAWFLAILLAGVLASQLMPLAGYSRERLALEYSHSP